MFEKMIVEGKEVEVSKTLSPIKGEHVVYKDKIYKCVGQTGCFRNFSLNLRKESTNEDIWVKIPKTRYIFPIMMPKGFIKT